MNASGSAPTTGRRSSKRRGRVTPPLSATQLAAAVPAVINQASHPGMAKSVKRAKANHTALTDSGNPDVAAPSDAIASVDLTQPMADEGKEKSPEIVKQATAAKQAKEVGSSDKRSRPSRRGYLIKRRFAVPSLLEQISTQTMFRSKKLWKVKFDSPPFCKAYCRLIFCCWFVLFTWLLIPIQ